MHTLILENGISNEATLIIIIAAVLAVVTLFIFLFFAILVPTSYKKQVKNIEKSFSYLDAKLIGKDSQYIHRIEIISRTNLLYLDHYEKFSRRFKNVFETEDKFVETMIKQLNSLIAAKQFKNIKSVIAETKRALDQFEESVNSLDSDLYEIISLEENARKKVDDLKEIYRHVKQTYYTESADLEMVAQTFNKTFDKIDETFSEIEDNIESADYDSINEKIPVLNSVLIALGKVLIELPTLCALVKTVVNEKIVEIQNKYREIEKQSVPLFHLSFKARVDDWRKRLSDLSKKIINLQTAGVSTECNLIMTEINNVSDLLDKEVEARSYFRDNYESVYRDVNEVQQTFIKISSMLPQIKNVYMIGQDQEDKIKELSVAVTNLGNSKRYLDGFVLSGTRQPYSLLKNQLDELRMNYDIVSVGVNNFKNYIDSLKTTAEEAYKMIYVYYLRVKEIEKVLADIDVEECTNSYLEKIEAVYDILNYVYNLIQTKPINVEAVASKIEQLNNISNAMFEEIDSKARLSSLAESAIVVLNKDRKQQDVNQALEQLETGFFKGEFEMVYNQANVIYQNLNTHHE